MSHRPEHVVVLYNLPVSPVKGDPRDLRADLSVVICAQAVAEALATRGSQVASVPIVGDVEQALLPYPPTDWIVFNLGEGFAGRLFEEVRIAWALEAMGYRYTGADAFSLALSTHKARAKEALALAGVPTPAWRTFCAPSVVHEAALGALTWPLIVKPVAEDASLGISSDSVVYNIEDLRARVGDVVAQYRQAALVEGFVDGREVNAALWGDPPEVLPVSEVTFGAADTPAERILTFASKWEPGTPDWNRSPVACPADLDAAQLAGVRAVSRQAWEAIGCRGYARVDVRLDADNVPWVIEVNCNPDLSPDAGFFRSAQAAGHTYADMAHKVLEMVQG